MAKLPETVESWTQMRSDQRMTDENQTETLSGRLHSLTWLVLIQVLVAAAGLIVEILAGRMLAPYVGMSLYTWTAVIAVVLAGFSAGHWLGGIFAQKPRDEALVLTGLCMALAALTTALTLVFLRMTAAKVVGNSPNAGFAILLLTAIVVFLPSFFAGVPSPVLARVAVGLREGEEGRALGAIFAAGSIGAIFGTLATGFLFIAWLGTSLTIAMVCAIYAGLALVLSFASGPDRYRWGSILSCLVAAGLCVINQSRTSVCTKESQYYCIRIIDFSRQAGADAKLMVLDHLGHGINVADDPQRLLTPYVATLDTVLTKRLGRRPRSSYFIGGGAYTLPRAWLSDPSAPNVTVAEVDPDVTTLARELMWLPESGITIFHEDARAVLRARDVRYEVIVGDAFTDIAVPPHLVTLEFFKLVRSRLEPDGIYAMNVVDHAGSLRALLAVFRTMSEVFEAVEVFAEEEDLASGGRTTFVLFGSRKPSGLRRLNDPLDEERSFVALNPSRLKDRAAATGAVLLTDDYAPIDRLVGIGEL